VVRMEDFIEVGPSAKCFTEVGEIITEANRLCDLLGRIKRHWEDGCNEDGNPWDEKMQSLLSEIGDR
jgi:hypothetical protein